MNPGSRFAGHELPLNVIEKLGNLNRKRAILCACVLLPILVGLGYFRVFRPVILVDTDQVEINVKNTGGMDAIIYKVDGFWYWAGQVALLANMPGIHQQVGAGAGPVRLGIPDIPVPSEQATQQSVFYMKLAVRYRIPGIPIFRYTTPLYFKYDPVHKMWAATKSIPPKYRSLGKLTMGNVGKIELTFH